MEVRFLGPFEVVRAGRAVSVGGGRQRTLLAVLALHANEVVPATRLIDDLWPEQPPDSALNNLQGYVSRLRKALDGDGDEEPVIQYRNGGYVLLLPTEAIDAHRFSRLVSEGERRRAAGDVAAASNVLGQALDLWRGMALSDFVDEPFAQAEITRLEELRLKAVEDRIDAELECGRHDELVPELEALVAEHPYRERLRRQLMVALYRSGRQGDALEAFRQARTALVEGLGIEPTPALRELERAILRQDATLEAPRVNGRPPRVVARRRRRRWAAVAAGAALLASASAVVFFARSGDEGSVTVARNSVAVVDPTTNEVIDDVVVGDYPGPIAAGNGSVWVGNTGANTMTRIDARTREPEFPAGVQRPLDLAVTKKAVWTANASDFQTEPPTGGGTVERRGLRKGALTTVRLGPRGALDEGATFVASDGDRVWAANANSRLLVQLDVRSARVVRRRFGIVPSDVAVGYGSVWVAERARRSVVRLDPSTLEIAARVPISGAPTKLAVGEQAVWVITEGVNSAVWRIDPETNETVAVLPVPRTPRAIAAGAGSAWVTSGRGNAEAAPRRGLLSRIDPRRNAVVATLDLGFRPDGVVVADGLVWVAVAPD